MPAKGVERAWRGRAKKRILVAEDDLEMRRLVVDALVEDGHDVLAVGDGAALLVELARSDRFHYRSVDLVIADVRMPICSGLEALETLRGVGAPFPFLLMTAFGDDELHEKARRLGATLIAKPFSMARLRKTIADALATRRTG